MKWLFVILILSDMVYQLFGIVGDKSWSNYYDVTHYAAFMVISLILSNFKFKTVYSVFTLYFGFAFACSVWQIFNPVFFDSGAYYWSSGIFLTITIFFLIWMSLKKIGK